MYTFYLDAYIYVYSSRRSGFSLAPLRPTFLYFPSSTPFALKFFQKFFSLSFSFFLPLLLSFPLFPSYILYLYVLRCVLLTGFSAIAENSRSFAAQLSIKKEKAFGFLPFLYIINIFPAYIFNVIFSKSF